VRASRTYDGLPAELRRAVIILNKYMIKIQKSRRQEGIRELGCDQAGGCVTLQGVREDARGGPVD
jgi:hypothetical protein